jgi:tRNA dimethylallyltransferase
MKRPFLLVVSGPTAVGKSNLVEQLSRMISAEIINGDMGQCYTPFSIGTAKPHWRNSPIAYHLFDIINEPRDFTVVEYYQKVREKVIDIWSRNHLPIIVGGSGFYLASLFFPPKYATPFSTSINETSPDKLWQQLYDIDPLRAQQIGRSDVYRLKRAVEIWLSTHTKPSEYVPTYDPVCKNFRFIFYIREKEELHKRINRRVKEMVDNGWLQEVQNIMETRWENFLQRKKIIGYNDILLFLRQENQTEKEREKMIHTISKHTRKYAKRQMTFWRMLSRRLQEYAPGNTVETVNLSHIEIDEYISKLSKELMVEI